MIYCVFTREGYEQVLPKLQENDTKLWINKGVLIIDEINVLKEKGIVVNELSKAYNPNKDSEICAAVDEVEKHCGDDEEMLVEYP
ncbi:MAG: hypothetical protein K6L73_08680 [Cellvibrionaceae bacterium]